MNVYKTPSGNLLPLLESAKPVGQAFFLLLAGELLCTANHTSYHISARSFVLFPSPENISNISLGTGSRGYLVIFSQKMLDSFHLNIDNTETWRRLITLQTITISKHEADTYKLYAETMLDCLSDTGNIYREESAWLVAKAFAYKTQHLLASYLASQDNAYDRKEQLVRDFMSLIHENGTKHRDLEFYADKLCISPKYLSHVVSKVTGRKCLSWIEDFTINKARQLLKSTDLSISQISYELNFAAPTDFCRYFRTRTGISPKQYRLSGEE